MVTGLNRFQEAFKDHYDSYVIIGGTACDLLLNREGLIPRATKDIDMVVIIESLNAEFVNQFWKFLTEGQYRSLEKELGERKYYRFKDPAGVEYPRQIELFSRTPDAIDDSHPSRFTRIKVEEAVYGLSAILMDDTYYSYTVDRSSMVEGVHVANAESVICLKARAFLDLEHRRTRGEQIDDGDIKKHKNDVFRLAAMLRPADRFHLPASVRSDMKQFVDVIKDQIPSDDILKRLGAGNLTTRDLHSQLYLNFDLT
jgi:hypothetical protein